MKSGMVPIIFVKKQWTSPFRNGTIGAYGPVAERTRAVFPLSRKRALKGFLSTTMICPCHIPHFLYHKNSEIYQDHSSSCIVHSFFFFFFLIIRAFVLHQSIAEVSFNLLTTLIGVFMKKGG